MEDIENKEDSKNNDSEYEEVVMVQRRLKKTDQQIRSEKYVEEMTEQLEDIEQATKLTRLKNKMLETNNFRDTPKARKLRKFYKKFNIPRVVVFAMLLILPFFEKPIWCASGNYQDNCQHPDGEPDIFIPNSDLPFINYGRLRRIFRTYLKITYKGFPLLFALFFNVILFVGMGRVLFHDVHVYVDGVDQNYFYDFFEAFYVLTVALTTSNYPGCMLIFYEKYRWAPIFFVVYLVLEYLLLTNMLLGVFYSHFKAALQNKTNEFYLDEDFTQDNVRQYEKYNEKLKLRKQQRKAQKAAEKELKQGSSGGNSSKRNSISSSSIGGIPEYKTGNNSGLRDDVDSDDEIFDDENFQGVQSEYEEELEQLEQLQNERYYTVEEIMKIANRNFKRLQKKEEKKKGKKKAVEAPVSPARQKLRDYLVNDPKFQIFLGTLSFLNLFFLYIQTNNSNDGKISAMGYINLTINSVFLVEGYVKLYALGFKLFIKKFYYIYEFVVVNAAEVFFIIYFLTGKYGYMIEFFILLKTVRFLQMMSKIKSLGIIYASIVSFFPFFQDLFMVVMMQFYLFAGIGEQLFGGRYRSDKFTPDKFQIEDPKYIYNNFNDLASGFIVLFEVIISDGFETHIDIAIYIMGGSKWYRIYWILWYIIGILIALQIMVAFIIDFLVNQWDRFRIEEELKEKELQRKKKEEELRKKIENKRSAITLKSMNNASDMKQNMLYHNDSDFDSRNSSVLNDTQQNLNQ
ncbi:hypothetical protein PPERSA_10273 [Pseudocohnilembus persalinus]|uniref:Ion transport domain-containing protein n=1 Tax=Pseudocohnilembus persalinus TaxID=266149 RepID=A0A0V0R0K1_PSEPJ|nr:hypothetical protein PPERSA_10273 [Pseudocohnilembus persalinus]|eukprot:KRX07885.1 hypothetical protein PPERSA_10273 [Pseudocohnilembus persalinus]